MKYVNVYLSARDVPAPYLEATKELGESLAESGYGTVFGASDSGAMGVLADAVLAKNGVIIGISMEMLRDSARADLTETIIAPSLDERKDLMDQRSDAFIVMPGGVGTLDEVAKVMELKKQRVHNRPIIFVNTNGFWDDFRRQLTRMEDEGFLKNPIDELVTFCATPKEAIISLDHALT